MSEQRSSFLFTDVEGSTRLWERYPAVMSQVIARQEDILQAAVRAHTGSVFNTAGDGVYAIFPEPARAVAAAVAAQRALLAEPWDDYASDLRISVRMAVGSGAVHSTGEGYLGPVLNQLHRLMRTGHGGQILCNGNFGDEYDPPAGITLRYLGSHALRDVTGDTRIFQIEAPGLPHTFPRLVVERLPSTRLPYQSGFLVGRDRALATIGAEFRGRSTRMVTLLGPGGVGKTTLAVALAGQLDDAFPDGVHFVDLSALQDGQLVGPLVAGALSLDDPLLEPEDALIAGLRSRELLLILDNCEQVVGEVARLVTRLMAETAQVSVLVTSRLPLRIAAEQERPVEPLPLPASGTDANTNPAVQLFVEHARQVNGRFQLTETSLAAVVDICRMVDGLPLALELAAAWVRILDAPTLRDRLAAGAPLLRSDERDRPERHRTLASTIDWSYQLLDPETQAAFRRLSVFQGGIPLDGALSVLQANDRATVVEALEQLDRLVQANLLQMPAQTPDGPRYRFLQTIQEFSASVVSTEEQSDIAHAHAVYFAAMAATAEEHYRGPDAARWLDRLDANRDNLRAAVVWLATGENADHDAALRMATELYEFYDVRNRQQDAKNLLTRALAAASTAPARVRARALGQLGNLWLGNFEQAETYYRESLSVAATAPENQWQMTSTLGLGSLAFMRGDYDTAQALARGVLDHARASGEPAAVAHALLNLGDLLHQIGRSEDAAAILDESLALCEQIGDAVGVAWARKTLGLVALELRQPAEAERDLRRALSEFDDFDETVSAALCRIDLASFELGSDLETAAALLTRAAADLLPVADVFIATYILDAASEFFLHDGNPESALEIFSAADAWRRSTGAQIAPVYQVRLAETRAAATNMLEPRTAQSAIGRGERHSMRDALLVVQTALHAREQHSSDAVPARTIAR